MVFKNKKELHDFLSLNVNPNSCGTFALAKYNGIKEFIYFAQHHLENEETGKTELYFLEAPVDLYRYPVDLKTIKDVQELIVELKEKYLETSEGKSYAFDELVSAINNGYIYDLDMPQTSPFLPNDKEMDITLVSEKYVIENLKKQFKDM